MRVMSKRWIIAAAFLAVMAWLPGCGRSEEDKAALKMEIEAVLRENPEIVLDILQQHGELVFEYAEAGLEAKQLRARVERYQEDLLSPRRPEIEPDRAMRGDPNAPLTIVEYSDFQCPYCANAASTVDRILAEYAGKVRLVFKQTPLGSHENAMLAAKYFEAASMQDPEKAWLLHDAMFLERQALTDRGEDWIKEVAGTIGLDVAKLEEDAHGNAVIARVGRDMDEADRFGFTATPTFVVGGVELVGAAPYEEFAMVVDMVLEYQARQNAPLQGENP